MLAWGKASTTTRKCHLLSHLKRHNGVMITFTCDICELKTKEKRHLLEHIKSKHEGVRFPCDKCDYEAAYKSSLRTHIKSKHEDVSFPCDICDYNYSSWQCISWTLCTFEWFTAPSESKMTLSQLHKNMTFIWQQSCVTDHNNQGHVEIVIYCICSDNSVSENARLWVWYKLCWVNWIMNNRMQLTNGSCLFVSLV